MQRYISFVLFLSACLGTGYLGSLINEESVWTWYRQIEKPSWTPPDRMFGPVWTALYIAMAAAAWLVWLRRGWGREMNLFAAQLALNLGWTAVFFGLRSPGWAFVEIFFLIAAIAATLAAFWRVRPAAGWLLVPYLSWTSFAAALNFTIWRLNT